MAPAAVAAIGLDVTAAVDPQYWLATPVHCFAGLDSVQLHPAGLLELPASEQSALAAEFTRVFADTPWRLHATGQRELLLSGAPLAASAADPAASIGADLRDGLPRGPRPPHCGAWGSRSKCGCMNTRSIASARRAANCP